MLDRACASNLFVCRRAEGANLRTRRARRIYRAMPQTHIVNAFHTHRLKYEGSTWVFFPMHACGAAAICSKSRMRILAQSTASA
jgi:hypothetical protein